MSVFKEFREFAIKGNVIDLAVGIIIGGAFGGIVKSLVDDIIMPPIGLILGSVDFSNLFLVLKAGKSGAHHYLTLADGVKDGAVLLRYGVFGNVVVSFVIVSFAVFMLVRAVNELKRLEARHEAAAEIAKTPEQPRAEVLLLTEIRDALTQQSGRA